MIHRAALRSGASVLSERVPGAGAVSIGFWFPRGSRHEGEGTRGYSHFVEHMLFKGTPARGAREIAREIDRVGGYINAFTEREHTCVHCVLPLESFRIALDVLCDMVFASSFPETEFEKERSVIINEILSSQDDPEEMANETFLAGIWPDQDLSRPIAGEVDDARSATRDGLYAFYRERYVPGALLVTVAGDLDPEMVASMLDDRLSPGPAAPPASVPLVPPVFSPGSRYVATRMQQVQLYFGTQVDGPFTGKDYYALSVLDCAFGESMSSRLFQKLREGMGYCYTVHSYAGFGTDFALWCVYASTTSGQARSLVDALSDEFSALAEGGITEVEIEEAKSHLAGSLAVASSDMEHRMKRLARQHYFDGVVRGIDESIASIRSIGPAEVAEAAGRICRPAGMALFGYGPGSARRAFSPRGRAGKWLR